MVTSPGGALVSSQPRPSWGCPPLDVPGRVPGASGSWAGWRPNGKQAPTYRARRQRGAQGHSRGRWPVGGASSGCCGRPAGPSRRWGGPKAAETTCPDASGRSGASWAAWRGRASIAHAGAPGKHGRVYARATGPRGHLGWGGQRMTLALVGRPLESHSRGQRVDTRLNPPSVGAFSGREFRDV